MAALLGRELIHVALFNGVTGEKYAGECEFWSAWGHSFPIVCTLDRVAYAAAWEWNAGGLWAHFNEREDFRGTWERFPLEKACTFFLFDSNTPLDRHADLSGNIVRDEKGRAWLNLKVIKKQPE